MTPNLPPLMLLASLVGLPLHHVRVCDPPWLPISRPAGEAFFVATPVEPTGSGWRFTIELAGGNAAGLPQGPVLLIPWSYGPDCSPLTWAPRDGWQPPPGAAFYTAHLRHQDSWREGLPTFDVYMAWREPMWQSRDARWPHPASRSDLLTAAEFFRLYAALPTDDELNQSRDRVLGRASQFAVEHPELAAREPARTIWANVRRAVDDTVPGSAVSLSLDFPHGATRLHVERDGSGQLSYGALPVFHEVPAGTFRFEDVIGQLRVHLRRVVPAERRPHGVAYGTVTIRSDNGRIREYLLYAADAAGRLFRTACRHLMVRDSVQFERACRDFTP